MKYKISDFALLLIAFILTSFIGMETTTVVFAKPVINANTTYYDVDSGLYMLKGNVYVGVGDRVITAEQAKVSMSSLEVWASDGITLTQGNISLSAYSVHVYGAQNKALIEGGVTFKQSGITITADQTEFNWSSKLAVFSGNVQVTKEGRTWMADSATYNVDTNALQ